MAENNFSTIDWIKDTQKERNRLKLINTLTGRELLLEKIKENFMDNALIIVIAVTVALVNTMIIKQEYWLLELKNCFGAKCIGFNWLVYIVLGTIYALVAVLIVLNVSILAAGSGIPQVKTILGGFVIKHFLGFRTLVAKLFGLALADASSLCLGKEGPLVHLSCCVANIYCKFIPKYANNKANRREIMSAACAAGVAVAFGSPIGGVLFSLEEVSYYFPFTTMSKSFYMATLASLTIHLLNPYGTGKLVMFQVEILKNWELYELPVFLLLGLLGGLYGCIFIRWNIKLQHYRRQSTLIVSNPIKEVIVLAFVSAVVLYPFILTRASLTELVTNLFRDCDTVDNEFLVLCNGGFSAAISLLYTIIIVSALTILTFGIKVPAGLFVPSMAVGASTGRLVGLIIQTAIKNNLQIFPGCNISNYCVNPGHFAIAGAASFLAGVTRMTVF